MQISIEIEAESGVAIVRCSGVLDRQDALRAAERLWATPGWQGESAVWDFRAARFDLSALDVRRVAGLILKNQPDAPPSRMAFVTPRDAEFGMARMFKVFRDDRKTAFHVFRDYEEAISWAGGSDTGVP